MAGSGLLERRNKEIQPCENHLPMVTNQLFDDANYTLGSVYTKFEFSRVENLFLFKVPLKFIDNQVALDNF